MKKNYFSSSGKPARSTLICTTVFLLLLIISKLNPSDASAQIWGPEGLNMPGAWTYGQISNGLHQIPFRLEIR